MIGLAPWILPEGSRYMVSANLDATMRYTKKKIYHVAIGCHVHFPNLRKNFTSGTTRERC